MRGWVMERKKGDENQKGRELTLIISAASCPRRVRPLCDAALTLALPPTTTTIDPVNVAEKVEEK